MRDKHFLENRMAVKNANSPAIVQAPELLERVILCKEQPLLLVLLLAL